MRDLRTGKKRTSRIFRQKEEDVMQEIDGHTRLCGLIGNPVEHTMSPAIHNTLVETWFMYLSMWKKGRLGRR